jgi:MFS family permease
MALLAIVLQERLIRDEEKHPQAKKHTPESHPLKLLREMSPLLKSLLVSDILIRFCEQIPYAFVVVWCMKTLATPISAMEFGTLTAIEMATAMLVYIPVAYLADRSTKKPFVVTTFIFFTLFPLALMFAKSFWVLVPVFILRGLKEFGEPTRKALIMDLAPEDRKAGMFGLYYLCRDTIVSVAAFGGAFLWQASPQLNFMVAFGFGVLGTVWFALRGRDLGPAKEQPSL